LLQGHQEVKDEKKKVLVCLYKAGKFSENQDFLGCAENALGLREMLEKDGHKVIVTDNKEPEGESGMTSLGLLLGCMLSEF
jgi:helix-turn-helix protein